MGDERRRTRRERVEYLATLVSDEAPPRYCLVTDMSHGGVRINAVGFKVPNEFGLRLTGHAIPRRYSVTWRVVRNVGAMLIDPARPPTPNQSQTATTAL
jgi:hypothetical protein